ncbi:MAG: ATP-binding protein, partial [Deltaproteobacteria bacterium]|nr:ATP-binding protein [Deltaproteobacteria bacterium]
EHLSQLGLLVEKADNNSIKLGTNIISESQMSEVLSELINLLIAFYECKQRLSELGYKTQKLQNLINNLLTTVLEQDDFSEINSVLKNIALSCLDGCDFEQITVLEFKEDIFIKHLEFGLDNFSLESLPELKSYVLNNLSINLRFCELQNRDLYKKFCDQGIKNLSLYCRNKNIKLVMGVVSQKPLTEEEDYICHLVFDFVNFAIQTHYYQKKIVDYTAHLENLVTERTNSLEAEKKKAEEANSAKSRFISNMSHELRTPLTAIVGYSTILRDGLLGSLTEEQAQAIGNISAAAEHLKSLIDDVLNLARIESGKEVPHPEQIPLAYLHTILEMVKPLADQKEIALKLDSFTSDLENSFLYCDKRHFRQILLNLLSNAIKYTHQRGSVSIKISRLADKAKIEVIDTGIGIPQEQLDRLFERFERGQNQYSLEQEGAGIGLSITKSLIELNGGIIGVQSKVGQGSNFWFLIPVVGVKQADIVNQGVKLKRETLQNVRLLLVEDEAVTAKLLINMFTKCGGEVLWAKSVQEGLDLLQRYTVDILITDIGLPGSKNGLTLLSTVKNKLKLHLPVIMLSATLDPKTIDTAMQLGADDFIQKPFHPADLVARIQQLVSKYLITEIRK